MPFYNMGSAVVNFTLFAGDTGRVLLADTLPFHGGFVKSKNVQFHVNRDDPEQERLDRATSLKE